MDRSSRETVSSLDSSFQQKNTQGMSRKDLLRLAGGALAGLIVTGSTSGCDSELGTGAKGGNVSSTNEDYGFDHEKLQTPEGQKKILETEAAVVATGIAEALAKAENVTEVTEDMVVAEDTGVGYIVDKENPQDPDNSIQIFMLESTNTPDTSADEFSFLLDITENDPNNNSPTPYREVSVVATMPLTEKLIFADTPQQLTDAFKASSNEMEYKEISYTYLDAASQKLETFQAALGENGVTMNSSSSKTIEIDGEQPELKPIEDPSEFGELMSSLPKVQKDIIDHMESM